MLAIECFEQQQDFIGRLPVQITGRLIADQQSRIRDQRTGDSHPLLLTARQFTRFVICPIGQSNDLECDVCITAPLGSGQPGQQQRQLDIAARIEYRQQIVELKDEADVFRSPVGQRSARKRIEVFACDEYFARRLDDPDHR